MDSKDQNISMPINRIFHLIVFDENTTNYINYHVR